MVDNGGDVLQYDNPYWSTIIIEHTPGAGGNGNNPPVVSIDPLSSSPWTIVSPNYGIPVDFSTTSSDPEDGDLTHLIHW